MRREFVVACSLGPRFGDPDVRRNDLAAARRKQRSNALTALVFFVRYQVRPANEPPAYEPRKETVASPASIVNSTIVHSSHAGAEAEAEAEAGAGTEATGTLEETRRFDPVRLALFDQRVSPQSI